MISYTDDQQIEITLSKPFSN